MPESSPGGASGRPRGCERCERGRGGVLSLNHLVDPVTALREAARVTRRGGPILVATDAADDDHPVKAAVDVDHLARVDGRPSAEGEHLHQPAALATPDLGSAETIDVETAEQADPQRPWCDHRRKA